MKVQPIESLTSGFQTIVLKKSPAQVLVRTLLTFLFVFAIAFSANAVLPLVAPHEFGSQAYAGSRFLAEGGGTISAAEAEETRKAANPEEPKEYEKIDINLADGTYYGQAEGYKSTITVAVKVESNAIVSVEVVGQDDDPSYFNLASKITSSIVDNQSVEVDTITSATYSSTGIREATRDALEHPDSNVMLGILCNIPKIIYGVIAIVALIVIILATLKRTKETKPANARKATKRQRIGIQLLFFALAPTVFASSFAGIKTILIQMNQGAAVELTSFFWSLIALIAFTILFGRFFCGYACSFGFLNDIVYDAVSALCKKAKIKHPRIPQPATKILKYLKYVVLVAVLLGCALGAGTTINENSPWTAFSSLSSLSALGFTILGLILFIIVVVGMAFEKRFWCRFLCPLGAIFSILPTSPLGKVLRHKDHCRVDCKACHEICPGDIFPDNKVLAGDCFNCQQCHDVCPASNISVGLQKAEILLVENDKEQAKEELKQAKLANAKRKAIEVVIKALLLLVILWIFSCVRLLPTLGLF